MSATEVFRKLRLDNTKKLLVINAPREYENILEGLFYDGDFPESGQTGYDFIQIFATSREELENAIRKLAGAGKHDCLFWICYPKGGGKIKSDLKRDKIWDAFALVDLRPVTQIAIDETWSAMRGRPFDAVGK
jgi:hypothetical protein